MPSLIERMITDVREKGSDHLPLFGGAYEGGYHIQQVPEELARLTCCLASHGPYGSRLEIGVAAGGTTRFLTDWLDIERTTVIDDGKHPKYQIWQASKHHIPHLNDITCNSHSPKAERFLRDLPTAYDLVGIDGDHSEAGVKADWALVRPRLRDGAIIWFHDIVCCEGVKKLWQELKSEYTTLLETNNLGIGVIKWH